MLNPGSTKTADEQEEGGASQPTSLASSAVVVNVEEDEVRPLSSALLSDKQGVKRSRAGGSRAASSTGSSWTLADLDRRSTTSTVMTPDSMLGVPKDLLLVCRSIGLLNRNREDDPDVAQAIRRFAASTKLWPSVVLPLNEMVEKSQTLSDTSAFGSQVADWLFGVCLNFGVEDPEFLEIQDLQERFSLLLWSWSRGGALTKSSFPAFGMETSWRLAV